MTEIKERLIERATEVKKSVQQAQLDKSQELAEEQLDKDFSDLEGMEKKAEIMKSSARIDKDEKLEAIDEFLSTFSPVVKIENPPGAFEHETELEPEVSEELMKQFHEELEKIDREKLENADLDELDKLRDVYDDFTSKIEWS